MAQGQGLRYAELTCTPYTSVRPDAADLGMPIEAYTEAVDEWAERDPARRNWRDWWWEADDVRYLQFLGTDNVPFHAVSFPATLLGSGEPWTTVDVVVDRERSRDVGRGFHHRTLCGRREQGPRRCIRKPSQPAVSFHRSGI